MSEHLTHSRGDAVRLQQSRDELRAEVQAGIDQADRGELIPAEIVFARLEQRAREIEQSAQAGS